MILSSRESQIRRRRGLRPGAEAMEPRRVPSAVAEVEPNDVVTPQVVFGDAAPVIEGRLDPDSDLDVYRFNAVRGSTVRIHVDPGAGLAPALVVEGNGEDHSEIARVYAVLTPQRTVLPPPDIVFAAPATATFSVSVYSGSAGDFVARTGAYRLAITGADPIGDTGIRLSRATSRFFDFAYRNTSEAKATIEIFYARGPSASSILGKPLRTFRYGRYLRGFDELGTTSTLPSVPRPRRATHLVAIINRDGTLPDSDPSNNVQALALPGGRRKR